MSWLRPCFLTAIWKRVRNSSAHGPEPRIRENQLLIWLDGERQTFCRDVAIGIGELLWTDGHDIRVAYA